jgi:hypothetical protein
LCDFARRTGGGLGYAVGMQDEMAPPYENWEQHLKALSDRDLAQVAKDYQWLDCEGRAEEQRGEFHKRREAVLAECDRRGLGDLAKGCRRPAMGGGSRA